MLRQGEAEVIFFTVPGTPIGKGRARSTRSGRHYTPAKTAAYEELVAWSARVAMGSGKPLEGPVSVQIHAVATTPASWSKKRKDAAYWWTNVPDADNIAKSICDGANGILWVDDRQVVSLTVVKQFGAVAETRVLVCKLDSR
jgi:Holliday junction resolvase RusA-like endonuclease